MCETEKLVRTVFAGLAPRAIEGVEDAGKVIVVCASTKGEAVECTACGTPT